MIPESEYGAQGPPIKQEDDRPGEPIPLGAAVEKVNTAYWEGVWPGDGDGTGADDGDRGIVVENDYMQVDGYGLVFVYCVEWRHIPGVVRLALPFMIRPVDPSR
jgi:hypothetical protein